MLEHGLHDDLVGDGEELLVEGADDDRRPLAEVNDLVEGALGGVDVRAAAGRLDLGDARADDLGAAGLAQDEGLLEDVLVGAGLGNDMLAGAQDAMPARRVGAGHVGVRDGYDGDAQHGADPADGTHEGLMLAPPPLAAVVGPLDGGDGLLAQGRQQLERVDRGDGALGEHVLVAVVGDAADELVGGDAGLAGEALGGLGRGAVGVEGDLGLGPAEDLMDLVGRGGAGVDDHGEAPRGRERADLAMGEARLVQALSDELAQLVLGLHERGGGHLLAANLEEEVTGVGHLRPPPCWSCRPSRRRARGTPRSTP